MTKAVAAPPVSKTPLTDALPPKQAKFVREYMVDLNAAAAARRAGYAEVSARQQASVLMTKHDISEAIREQLDVNAGAPAAWIVSEIAKIARANARDVLSFGPGGVVLKDSDDLDDEVMAAISSASSTDTKFGTSISIKMHDKNAALFKLAEVAGIAKASKVEHTGKDGKDLIPPGSDAPIFIRAAIATRDEWETKMKTAQDDQARRDQAAIEDARKRKKV